MQQIFIIPEQDKQHMREFFIWCSNNDIPLENDYTELIKVNNL